MALIDPELLAIMACPFDRNDLFEDEPASRLVCTSCGRRFPVHEGIPWMRPEDAEPPSASADQGDASSQEPPG